MTLPYVPSWTDTWLQHQYNAERTNPEEGDAGPQFPAFPAAAERDYYQETSDILRAQLDLAPERFAAEREFRPQYAALDLGITQDTLRDWLPFFEGTVQPYTDRISATSRTAERTSDIADVEALGPRVTQAFRDSNPEGARLLDLMSEQAYSDLESGYDLTPEERRIATQSARTAHEDRGMLFSNPAIAMEALANDQYARQRYDERFRRAGNVLGYEKSLYGDPMMAVLGRPSSNLGFATGQQGFAQGYANAGPQIFNPESPYGSSLYGGNQAAAVGIYGTQYGGELDMWNTQFNAEAAREIAEINSGAARSGSGIGAIGSVVGGVIGAFCWVAREVYGTDDGRWMQFRSWMLWHAPRWFVKLYMRYGERFAAWIRDKPRIKGVIRQWMDAKINSEELQHAV